MSNKHTGSSFDSWLQEEGIYEEVTASAIKRVLARQITDEMNKQSITKSEMARRMDTSRSALERLLDPKSETTLNTLSKAAHAVGRSLRMELV